MPMRPNIRAAEMVELLTQFFSKLQCFSNPVLVIVWQVLPLVYPYENIWFCFQFYHCQTSMLWLSFDKYLSILCVYIYVHIRVLAEVYVLKSWHKLLYFFWKFGAKYILILELCPRCRGKYLAFELHTHSTPIYSILYVWQPLLYILCNPLHVIHIAVFSPSYLRDFGSICLHYWLFFDVGMEQEQMLWCGCRLHPSHTLPVHLDLGLGRTLHSVVHAELLFMWCVFSSTWWLEFWTVRVGWFC